MEYYYFKSVFIRVREKPITPKRIQLYHFMDITYYHQKFVLEMYTGILEGDVKLREEKNPLLWLPLTEDFTDRDRFAGEQNISSYHQRCT